jgi:hypothetical protein
LHFIDNEPLPSEESKESRVMHREENYFLVVDAQFDSYRPNNIWILKYFVNKDLFCLQRTFFDCVNAKEETHEDSKTLEEFVLSPNLVKKGSFEPTDMTQFVNTQLNFEFIFLLNDVKMSVLGRKYQ